MPAYDFVISVEIIAKTKPIGMVTKGLNDLISDKLKLKRRRKAKPSDNATTERSIKIITHLGRKVRRFTRRWNNVCIAMIEIVLYLSYFLTTIRISSFRPTMT